jgi:hypothetical protein
VKILELEQPIIGDIVEFETDPDTVVEGIIVAETEDGYIYEFSAGGFNELTEACTYGKYYCSTDKKYKCRQGPKQSRSVSEAETPESEIERLKLRQNAEHGSASLKRQAETQARIRELEKQIKDKGVGEAANAAQQAAIAIHKKEEMDEAHPNSKMYDQCWDGYKKVPGKKRGEKGSCVKEASGYIPRNSKEAADPRWSSALTVDVTTHTMRDQIGKFFPTAAPQDGQEQVTEAKYQGRTVPLGKPMKGDVKKSKVYVRNEKGNVVKVNFGDPNMRIKKTSPKHRKSFRARHHCENPGPRWKARYWSCRAW